MVMAEYATRSRTPIRVGFYDIIRTIGRGNFAVVKLARHRITKTEVAIKIIDKMRLDQINLKKIYREIQILKLLNHQHIIKLYQVMETSSTIYLVCEYARNGELFDYITEQGRLPEEKARRMFWQVLTAVEYCHKNNVVHRDLKAENLLLDSNNNIKLADFGFSNFFQSGNMLSTWCGSPPYAAPEVFEGKVYEGTQLDVWSLGVVLYVLVCGTFPFDGSNLATLKDRVLGGRFRIPYWMSQDCENLVRRMLVINPKKRLTVSQIKKHKWMQVNGPTQILSHTKSSPHLPRRGKLSEYNEHVLKVMQGLGINQQKTLESLQLSAYDHLYAIYHLLVDRLKMHRTSFPLEASFESGRRRPSNVADQALANMVQGAPQSSIFAKQAENTSLFQQENSFTDMQFDDMTKGLPTVHRTLPNPVRHSSPPLPTITTSVYEECGEEGENVPYTHNGTPPNPSYLMCQNMSQEYESTSDSANMPQTSHTFLSSGYQNSSRGRIKLGNYNLQQRRHTLMVPNLSQIEMLSAMSSAGQTSPQLSPHSSTVKLSKSGNEVYSSQDTDRMMGVTIAGSNSFDLKSPCVEDSISSDTRSQHEQVGLNYAKRTNAMFTSKNLQLPQKFNFDQQKVEGRPIGMMQRRSGVSPLVPGFTNQNISNENASQGEHQPPPGIAAVLKQRQLNTSPIGFREGRRASDGLLLLGDNLLKEHLQKLARTKGVPEMTVEDSDETWKSEEETRMGNHLSVRNPVNRCSSGEGVAQQQSSPTGTPVGSGGNIYFQPYSNSQSLARRRSLQVQHLQNRGASLSPKLEVSNVCTPPEPKHFELCIQTPTYRDGTEQAFSPGQENCSFHWSSWKHKVTTEGTSDLNSGTWQQLGIMKSGMKWSTEEPAPISMTTMSVASDEAVPSKAAAAVQQQQRESMTKPIRQQSLPITPTSTGHPFGVAHSQHTPSLAQVLQQRRLQRRLRVATHQQQNAGYQLPLPELEQLRIDNTEMFPNFQGFGTQNVPEQITQGLGSGIHEQSISNNWPGQGFPYATAVHAEEPHDASDSNEPMLPVPSQYPIQEMLAHQNQHVQLENLLLAQAQPAISKPVADPELRWMLQSTETYQNTISLGGQIPTEKYTDANVFNYGGAESMEFALY